MKKEKLTTMSYDKSKTLDDACHILTIMNDLLNQGYEFEDEKECIQIIEDKNIDVSGYILPYGCATVDEWKTVQQNIQARCETINSGSQSKTYTMGNPKIRQ